MAQNQKFKIKEFEWFEMETKVRQIIQEVLGPMQKRILQSANTLHKVKINQTEDQDRINQIALMIANDPKVFETGVFHTVDLRFEDQAKHTEELSRQISEASKYVEEKFKILDIRMQQSSEVLRNVASLRERISKEIELQNDNINSLRTNLTDMIENLNGQIKQNRRNFQQNFEACQKEDLFLNQKVKNINISIQNIDATLVNNREMHREKAIKIEEHSQLLSKHKEDIAGLQESKQLTKKLQQIVKQMDNELTRAEFKVDNIIPLVTQAQISDCLFNVLPNKLKKKITIFQYKKYFQLNRQVLQKPYKQVKERFASQELLEEMQKRNTKEIVQLKRKKLLSMGIDIDHLTYEQRERYYNEVQLDAQLDLDEDEVKMNNKVDEKQIVQIISSYFQQFTSEVSQKIGIDLQDSKKYIYGFEEEVRYRLALYQTNFQSAKRQCETFHTEQLLQNKTYEQHHKDVGRQFISVRKEITSVKDLQRLFYNFCSLVNHLQIQDEIDKQNISLMGVQQNNSDSPGIMKDRSSIIQLQKKCFSCCGYPASTLSAFKMACLTYNPSAIKIDSKDYKRQELLQFTTNMLHNIKKSIQGQGVDSAPKEFVMSSINRQTLEPTMDKPQFETYEQSKMMGTGKLDSEQNQIFKRSTQNKFRKTKKYNSINSSHANSVNKYNTKTKTYHKPGNEDMMNLSAAFTELKKRNVSFLA